MGLLQRITELHGKEISASSAIVGGILAQEVTKEIANDSNPWSNVIVVDTMGETSQEGGALVSKIP